MALKQPISVYVSSNKVEAFDATVDFTTDAILWSDFKGYTLNIWFDPLNGGNPKPKITFEASNTSGSSSFRTYSNISDIDLPELFEDSFFTPKYIRFVYDSSGVGAGSLITFTLNKNVL